MSQYSEEEAKFQDYNYDEDFQEVQYGYTRTRHTDDEDNGHGNSYMKKQRKMLNQLNSVDKDQRIITIDVNGVKEDVEVYATNDYPGTIIKAAIGGSRVHPYKVGSLDEHLFFKVKLAVNGMKANSDVFFFDTPEQFERHLHTVVTLDIKEKWTNKFVETRERNSKA